MQSILTIESLYPVMILMNVVVGCLLLFFFWGKRDRSSILWACGSFTFASGIALVLVGALLHPSVRYIGANFATLFPFFLCVQSIVCLFEEKPLRLWRGALISLGFGLGVYLLVLFNQRYLIPLFVGVGFGSVQFWSAYVLRQINRDRNNSYIRFFIYLFVVGGIVWVIRGALSHLFKFEFAPDPAIANWVVMFALTALVLLRQMVYLLLRFGRTQEEKEVIESLNAKLTQTIEQKNTLIKTLATSVKASQVGGAVAGIVHELSQPLAAIGLNTELLIQTMNQPSDPLWLKGVLGYIHQDNQRASGIINKLRKFYTKGEDDFSTFDWSALVLNVVDIAMPSYVAARVKLNPRLTSGIFVSGDQRQLEMVVLNLLTNAQSACDISPISQHVLVDSRIESDTAILEVTDNGRGIAEDQQQNIFNLFHTTKAHGMGVGLWLSREIMHNHQGEIELIHSKPGSTCFRLTMPLAKVASPDKKTIDAR